MDKATAQFRLDAVEAVLNEWEQSYNIPVLPAHWGITARISQFREALAAEIPEPDYTFKVLHPNDLKYGDLFTHEDQEFRVIHVYPRRKLSSFQTLGVVSPNLEDPEVEVFSLSLTETLDVSRPMV